MTKKQASDIAALIKKSHSILLTTHINPDGDGLGSGSALVSVLSKMGKKVDFINRDPLPDIYRFLPSSGKIKNINKVKGCYDLAIFLECPDLARNGHIIDHIKQAKRTINIDHHLGNVMYGDLNVVEPKAAAVGMQLYQFMKFNGWKISKDVACGLYTAIVTDTGSFAYSNTSPEVHQVTAELIKAGANPNQISGEVYATTLSSTRLMAKMLTALKFEGKAAWSVVTKKMFKETGAKESDTDNFINSIRSIRGVDIAVLFKEVTADSVKVSFRSKHGVDVNMIATELNGGGHKYASGCFIKKPVKEAEKLVISEIRKYFKTRKK